MENRLDVEGLHWQVYQYGQAGFPVLLLHGGGSDSALLSWGMLNPLLALRRQVFLPSWPGYGASQPLAGDYTLSRLVSLLPGLFSALGIECADIAGISMGGGAALGLALEHPELVRKLVLVDSYGLADRAPYHFLSWLVVRLPGFIPLTWAFTRRSRGAARLALASIFHNPRAVSDSLVDEVYRALQIPGVGRAFYSFQRSELLWNRLRTVYYPRLGELQAETLLVHGEEDSLVPASWAQQAARRIPKARLVLLPGCGHWPQREQPQAFNQAVLDFLGS